MTPAQKYAQLLHANIKALLPNCTIATMQDAQRFGVQVTYKGKRSEYIFSNAEIDALLIESPLLKEHAHKLAIDFAKSLQ